MSDVNVVYKHSALERTRDVWRERYHEPGRSGYRAADGRMGLGETIGVPSGRSSADRCTQAVKGERRGLEVFSGPDFVHLQKPARA